MRVVVHNSEKLTTRQARWGLFCIWELARDGERMRLVARWIDPDASVSGADDDTPEREEEAGGLSSASLRAA
jgi:hypothetical protein